MESGTRSPERFSDRTYKPRQRDTSDLQAGLIGLGLMGTSIATCLLSAGHSVRGLESDATKRRRAKGRVLVLLKEMIREGLLRADPTRVIERFRVCDDFSVLAGCQVVVESITEDLQAKKRALRQVEKVIAPEALIGTNTSAIPITDLQRGAFHPERIVGIHWSEPAHVTCFMEIICGRLTSLTCARRALAFARAWGKDPSLLCRDVRGFIANRISYAMFREAFHLVESGVATIADVDRSLRNDVGWWITFAGPFRYMDLMGIPAYAIVMRDLLPDLNRDTKVPPLMQKVVASGACGVSNLRGFYRYTPAEARRWEKEFLRFNYAIRKLAMTCPEEPRTRHHDSR